jgi:hypothetical protein
MGVVVRCLLLYPTCLVVAAEVAGYLSSWKVYQYRLVVVAVVVVWEYIHAGMGAVLLLGAVVREGAVLLVTVLLPVAVVQERTALLPVAVVQERTALLLATVLLPGAVHRRQFRRSRNQSL